MRYPMRAGAMLAVLIAIACRDAAAPEATTALDVTVPTIPARPALVDGDTLPSEGAPPSEAPEEVRRPVTIRNFWTRAGVSNEYASAESYMEYLANQAKQTLYLNVLADGRQIATVPPAISAASWFLPIYGSLRTFSGVRIQSTCGISAVAVGQHEARNEWQFPGTSPWVFSYESEPSSGNAGQPACIETPPKSPTLDDGLAGGGEGGGGGGGEDGSGGSSYYYLSCWYTLTYVGDVLTELDQVSCTIFS